jgi:DNA-binding transcriptional LysR family regulator
MRVIHADTALMQLDQLRERNVELLVGRMPRPFMEDDLVSEQLFDEPFVTVAGMPSRWARRRQIELAELAEESWALPPYDSAPGLLITSIFRNAGLTSPTQSSVTLSVQLTTTLVATGKFVGILPTVAQFSAKLVGLKVLPVKVPGMRASVSIVTVKRRTISPLAELFIGSARTVAKSISAPAMRRKANIGR